MCEGGVFFLNNTISCSPELSTNEKNKNKTKKQKQTNKQKLNKTKNKQTNKNKKHTIFYHDEFYIVCIMLSFTTNNSQINQLLGNFRLKTHKQTNKQYKQTNKQKKTSKLYSRNVCVKYIKAF